MLIFVNFVKEKGCAPMYIITQNNTLYGGKETYEKKIFHTYRAPGGDRDHNYYFKLKFIA